MKIIILLYLTLNTINGDFGIATINLANELPNSRTQAELTNILLDDTFIDKSPNLVFLLHTRLKALRILKSKLDILKDVYAFVHHEDLQTIISNIHEKYSKLLMEFNQDLTYILTDSNSIKKKNKIETDKTNLEPYGPAPKAPLFARILEALTTSYNTPSITS